MLKTTLEDVVLTPENVWEIYAPLYDQFTPYFQRDLLREVARGIYGVVLDAGMGAGKLLQYLDSSVELYSGIDTNPQMIAYALKNQTTSFPAHFIRDDVQMIPFSSEKFDSAVGINVLYSLPRPDAHLREIFRVLKQKGRFVLVSQAHDFNLSSLQKLAEEEIGPRLSEDENLRQRWGLYIRCNEFLTAPDGFKPWQYSEEEIGDLLEHIGFRVVGKGENNYFGNLFHTLAEKQ